MTAQAAGGESRRMELQIRLENRTELDKERRQRFF